MVTVILGSPNMREVKASNGSTNEIPADTRRNNNVIIMSKRRRFDIIMTLSLRYMSAGMYQTMFSAR